MDDPERVCGKLRTAEPKEFFLSREKNLSLSLLLLLGCYAAILYPAYFPKQQNIWRDDQLEARREKLLNHSASLLSRTCRPGWSAARLRVVHPEQLPTGVPVFLQHWQGEWRLRPPLGLLGSEEKVAETLRSLPQRGLPPELRAGGCTRCVVVGSGGVLRGSHIGTRIDQHDVIIRMNNAPVSGFERDAGSRTTIRLTYPEGAPHSPGEYRNTSLVALVVFKSYDLDWLAGVVAKEPLGWWTKLWFWKEVVESIPLQPTSFRILNPEIVHETGQALQGYSNQPIGMSIPKVPTLGTCAVVMALRLCDEVNLAGFGYDLQHPDAPLHYYESIHMGTMKLQIVHDVSSENVFLRELVRANIVHDLTGGLS